ncbi:uncharacterized protein BJ212DRAFT_210653 [Suillus subaureus]|uniref:Uncharacterized protein n=1 Tax=Suillus subaureus TaxID=48587 RepID=A0A9P7EAR5_9AGAM|nr:uncharacterized protein BJ212DRAFT_210653 [Suillus subaureus]KAG1816080.1 hypothetical protein BJ212DRAFT_210653 [Suillus subaureus]
MEAWVMRRGSPPICPNPEVCTLPESFAFSNTSAGASILTASIYNASERAIPRCSKLTFATSRDALRTIVFNAYRSESLFGIGLRTTCLSHFKPVHALTGSAQARRQLGLALCELVVFPW